MHTRIDKPVRYKHLVGISAPHLKFLEYSTINAQIYQEGFSNLPHKFTQKIPHLCLDKVPVFNRNLWFSRIASLFFRDWILDFHECI